MFSAVMHLLKCVFVVNKIGLVKRFGDDHFIMFDDIENNAMLLYSQILSMGNHIYLECNETYVLANNDKVVITR